jgi:hypothetical protein
LTTNQHVSSKRIARPTTAIRLFRIRADRVLSRDSVVWHTTRHEFSSRALENAEGDLKVARGLTRQIDLKTLDGYFDPRRQRVLAAAAKWGAADSSRRWGLRCRCRGEQSSRAATRAPQVTMARSNGPTRIQLLAGARPLDEEAPALESPFGAHLLASQARRL